MKILFVLSCNEGAYTGNYEVHKNWIQIRQSIKKYQIKGSVTLSAIEHGINLNDPNHDKDLLGNIVLQSEMHRIKGHNIYPSYSYFKKQQYKPMDEITKYIKIALQRPEIQQQDLIILSNPVKAYKYAFITAVRELYGNISSKFICINGGESPSYFNQSNSKICQYIYYYQYYHRPLPTGGLYTVKELEGIKPFLYYDENCPTRFHFWKDIQSEQNIGYFTFQRLHDVNKK